MKSKKRIITLFLCGVLLLTGCQKQQMSQRIDLKLLAEQIQKSGQDWPEMEMVSSEDKDAKEMFSYLAEFPYSQVEEYYFLYSLDSTRAGYEVAVVRLKSEKDRKGLVQALDEHVKLRTRTFETYAPDQVLLMENASIIEQGQYVALFVTDENHKLADLFQKAQ